MYAKAFMHIDGQTGEGKSKDEGEGEVKGEIQERDECENGDG